MASVPATTREGKEMKVLIGVDPDRGSHTAVAIDGEECRLGEVRAALILGHSGDVTRFVSRHHYASYNGTAPIEASSGARKRHRLNNRGNRQLDRAIHMIAISQIRSDTAGRAYYQRKLDERKSKKEALRALKRRISDAVYRQLLIDADRAAA